MTINRDTTFIEPRKTAVSDEPSEMFFEIIEFLKERYTLNKSVLIVKNENAALSAISTWSNGIRQDGLTLNLPHKESLFERVIDDGRIYTEYFIGSFSGNFFERKLLLDDDSRSFALQPLKSDGQVVGMVGFSSKNPTAFALMEDGDSSDVFSQFAERLLKQKLTA
ncbi:MAG TPA: GAF domain-containing protein [candidate division Zixibacteria bacterium]|nr:GAF domain-containing protein [candidate division Zixibacteria bacterium]